VRLDRTNEAINSDVTSHDIVQAVVAGFRTLRTTHTSDDVRRAIVKVLGTWAAVTLRDGGGIYWVPEVYAAELRRLQGAIEKIGTSRVHVLPVHESQDANRALGAIATASLEAELAQVGRNGYAIDDEELADFRRHVDDRALASAKAWEWEPLT